MSLNQSSVSSISSSKSKSKSFYRVAIALILVVAVAATLWFAVPTQAFDVTFPSLPANGNLGATYSFTITVSIANAELLPLQSATLYLYNTSNRATYQATCNGLPLNNGTKAYTTTDTGGGTVAVTANAGAGWGYTYGYGYANWNGAGYSFFLPSGYGYGYGGSASSITYTINWIPPAGWPVGSYAAEVSIVANGTTFTRASGAFSLVTAGGGGTPPPTTVPPPDQVEQMTTTQAVVAVEAMSTANAAATIEQITITKAADIIENITIAKAVDIIETVSTTTAVNVIENVTTAKAAEILSGVLPETASTIMEQLTTDTLNQTIPSMSEASLTEILPGLTSDKLYSINPQVLFNALPNAPVEQLCSENPPQPPVGASAPIVVFSTPSGIQYLAIQTYAGEWVIVVATPAPLDKLLIKTKQVVKDVKTDLVISTTLPSDVTVGLPAGQVVRAYVKISLQNIKPEDIEVGHLTFKLEKDWLTANSIHPWSVMLHQYDATLKQWNKITTKRVDEDAQFVYYTVVISHFSTFAITGSTAAPVATIDTSNLVISKTAAKTGESITITANIINQSSTAGVYEAILWINETVETAKNVSLGPNETKQVSFTVTKNVAGTYQVRVDKLFGSYSVSVPTTTPTTPTTTPTTPTTTPTTPTTTPTTPTTTPTTSTTTPTPGPGTNWAMIVSIIAGVIIIAVVVVFVMRRRRGE